VTNLWAFDTRIIYPDDTHEDYGGRVSGAFIPSISGNWVFHFRVYDRGEVNLNIAGLGLTGKETILAEGTGNEPRNWVRFTSRSVSLLAGEPYYIEGLYQAGSALAPDTDVIKVAARFVGTPELTADDVPITDVDTNALAGAFIGFPLAPKDLGGTLTISQQPANTTAEEFHTVTFSVGLNNPSGLPVIYQWYKNDVAIEGANARTYSFQALSADDNASISVRAAKLGSVVTSASATLDVVPDNTAPTVVGAQSSQPFTNVLVTFSEGIQWAGDDVEVFNYSINDELAASANYDPATRTVSLGLQTPLAAGSSNLLTVSSFVDLSGNSGALTSLSFYAGIPGPLSITRQGNTVRVSWPLPGTGMILEQAATLDPPIGWQDISAGTYQTDATSRYIEAPATNTRFYRLRGN
jgi:hypothetical protein